MPKAEFGNEMVYLPNVLYVPDRDRNLFCVGRIEEMGLTVYFEKDKVLTRNSAKHNKLIPVGHRYGR